MMDTMFRPANRLDGGCVAQIWFDQTLLEAEHLPLRMASPFLEGKPLWKLDATPQ